MMEARASSSAHDAMSHQKRVRSRPSALHDTLPAPKPPRFVILDRYGPSLDPTLRPLARDVFLFDRQLLRRVLSIERKHTSSPDEVRRNQAVRWGEEYTEIQKQWVDINSCSNQFSQSYLQDTLFIPIWVKGLRIVQEALKGDRGYGNHIEQRQDYTVILAKYEKMACRLRDRLVDTACQGSKIDEVLPLIQERWIRLDEVLDECYYTYGDHWDEEPTFVRVAPKWQEVRWSIQENESRIKTGKESVRNPLSSMTAKTNQPFKITVILGRKVDGTFVLWLALFCGIFASVPLFVQGHALSPHEKGTTNDADFWFLKQASIMQLLGSIVSALLESRNGELPRWRWVLPSIIAAACSVTASPLYLLVPTEWSAFLSLIAGDTQSFMVLQHFLSSTKNSVVPDS